MALRACVVLAALWACGGHRDSPQKVPHDAMMVVVQANRPGNSPIPDIGDAHLDEDIPPRTGPIATQAHVSHPIDVTLHSTPPGAQVLIDGALVGVTPTFWNGQADGREHEFVFMRRGHATARYRFVPVTSGVIHARLERVSEEPDAGVDDNAALPGAALPGAGSMLVNPPPAPVAVAKPDAPPMDAALPTVAPATIDAAEGYGPPP